jgi:multidrug efflux pump subunit AcrB
VNPIAFALRHPITVITAIVALTLGAGLAISRMKVDIFPALNLPVVYVCQPYGGMDAAQIEGLLANYYEYHFLYINGIHHVESRNVQGVSLMKLFFHPGTDMAQAMAETVGYVNRSRAFMPPGTVPPFIMRFDTGSVPVGYLVLSSDTRTIGEIQDHALFKVRPMFSTLPGVSAPPPFGGSVRAIVVNVDPDRLRSYNLSPDDVVDALTKGNTISPSGAIRIGDQMPLVPSNSLVIQPKELGNIALRPGESVFLRDIATIEDGTDITTGYALANAKRAVYILVNKRADASTLDVVNAVKDNLPKMKAALPDEVRDEINVSFEFDQSPYVTNAIKDVGVEGLLGAGLIGLMVLVFLRDWRSVIVVVLNIPLALAASLFALWLCGHTVNLMTLGGLMLAVGILVDESAVAVENIHTQMHRSSSLAWAVRRGVEETAVPRLLAMLCILAVFLPALFMEGALRTLFLPLALAVGFAMIASYILSSTFVPVMCVWLLKTKTPSPPSPLPQSRERGERHIPSPGPSPKRGGEKNKSSLPAPPRNEEEIRVLPSPGFAGEGMGVRALRLLVRLRWLLVPAYVAGALALIWLFGRPLGTEIFPTVDAGQFQMRLRAPTGTRIEWTEQLTIQALDGVAEAAGGQDKIAMSLGWIGVVPSSFPINSVYLFTGGPEEAVIRIALRPNSGVRIAELKEKLRTLLPKKLGDWMSKRLADDGVPPAQIAERVRGIRLSFEPADIVNEIMSFGSPTPIEIAVSGTKLAANKQFADKLQSELAKIPGLRDLQQVQALDYPTVDVTIDRERAGQSGITAADVSRSLVTATSSSRFVVPNYWRDPGTGVAYQVQVQVPPPRMNTIAELGLIPVKENGDFPLLLRDVAEVRPGTMPGEYDRYNMRRLVSITANVAGTDLGRIARQIDAAIKSAGAPPTGVQVDVRGQIEPMRQLFGGLVQSDSSAGLSFWKSLAHTFSGLTLGLILTTVVILLLLTAYFQSLRLAMVSISTVPAVLGGVALALWLTGSTLNIQSFMGAIMAIGVAVANAILLVTFAERLRRETGDARAAAVEGARSRVRPILMTSFAMIAGMLPMAFGLGESGEQTAPLGRAVIGGLAASTVTALLILPSVFALVMGRAPNRSASLDPDDPASRYFHNQLATDAHQ